MLDKDSPSEKRFNSVMDKLFYSTKTAKPSIASTTSDQNNRGKKRGFVGSLSGVVSGGQFKRSMVPVGSLSNSAESPLCRPWDRGDLMKRISTFKSMTWFGKPKVVNAVNCALRGWINVEMDIIACQACGTRLLFSTPSSWTHQQIEKAAAVFSLKLDNGHKLLCPWIDNACEDTLAQFPPTTASALIDSYKERSRALIQLSALPIISSSAFEYLKGPQLESFLKISSTLEFDLGFGNSCRTEVLGDEQEAISPKIYNQAQKLISLCGWEPRFLPYVVDCTSSKCGVYEATEVNNEHQSDQASVVLDCKLCGASVGLWAFSTVSRPLQLVRLVESSSDIVETDVTNANNCTSENHTDGSRQLISYNRGVKHTSTSSQGQPSSLNLSIGGGPPPAKQNFRATVSLPIVSRHLRASLISNFAVRNHNTSSMSYTNLKSRHCDLLIPESFQHERDSHNTDTVQSEDMGLSSENGMQIFRSNNPSCSNHESLVKDSLTSNLDCVCSSKEILHSTLETIPVSKINIAEGREIMPHGSDKNNSMSQIVQHLITLSEENGTGVDCQLIDNEIPNNQLNKELSADGRHSVAGLHGSVCDPSCLDFVGSQDITNERDKQAETDPYQKQVSEEMKFDPIRQHRHFCPWVVLIGSAASGWQQTLSVLDRSKEVSHDIFPDSPSLSSIKVDDPIASIRRLFMSPHMKKMKIRHNQ